MNSSKFEMNNSEFLKRILDGYVLTYRTNLWHTTSNHCDMTATELNFFTQLGSYLGFVVRREMNWQYPRDLCWCEPGSDPRPADDEGTILYLERENQDKRVDQTIEKLLDIKNAPNVKFLVAVFGCIKQETLNAAKEEIRTRLGSDRSFLCISWIGDRPDDATDVEGWVFSNNHESTRKIKAYMDKAEYWYLWEREDSAQTGWVSTTS